MKAVVVIGLSGFVVLAAATTSEAPFVILFGWVPFLQRVVPEVSPDGPSVLVGAIAVLSFTAGIHWLGRSWRGTGTPHARWRARWTVAVVTGVLLLFTAGISVIGITHQVAWLATSDQPVVGQGLSRNRPADLHARTLGIGLTNYRDSNGTFPPGGTFTPRGEGLHSWETHLLPFLSYSTQGIDMQRPWNGPENGNFFKCVLPEFINPGYRVAPLEDGDGFGLSHYAANGRVLLANKSIPVGGMTDGNSNTILAGEVNAGFKPWGHPANWRDPAAGLNRGTNTFGDPRGRGAMFVMADGSVRFVGNEIDPAVLRALSGSRANE